MANGNRNNIISVPLNGELNFSKNKTKVAPFTGFNDINSPIYGDMISPLYTLKRKRDEAGNSRPYLDEYNVLRDENGQEILDLNGYKGLKRTELTNVPENALAVYDNNTYVDIVRNGESYYTAMHYGDITKGENRTKTLPFKANAASYTENGLIIINEKGRVHVYDAKTFSELANEDSISSTTAELITFYDPINKWNVISIYQPFGDWDYKRVSSYAEISDAWNDWNQEVSLKKSEIKRLKSEAADSKATYDDLKSQQDALQADYNDKKKSQDYYYDQYDEWKHRFIRWAHSPVFWKTDEARRNRDDYWNKYSDAKDQANAAKDALDTWNKKYTDDLNDAWADYDQHQAPIRVAESDLENLNKVEPQKYIDSQEASAANPNIYSGKCSEEAYNYIYKDGSLTRKTINIPWGELGQGSQGPTGESYIITGIYDVHFETNPDGTYKRNTSSDYIRYRLGVIPCDIGLGSNSGETKKYFFSLNYTPKIYFRKDTQDTKWSISSNIPEETKTYICNTKDNETAQDVDVYFSGSGKGNRAIIWGKVNFTQEDSEEVRNARNALDIAKKEESRTLSEKIAKNELYKTAQAEYDAIPSPTEEDTKKLEDAKQAYIAANEAYTEAVKNRNEAEEALDNILKALPDFNKMNLFHDLGYAKYTMYSPWSSKAGKGNATSDAVAGARDITKVNFNYELSSDNIPYETPIGEGDMLIPKNPKNIFREIINNGIISNISITEDREHIGTMVETSNSIDPKIPVFYKYGKNGKEVIFRTEHKKWISLEVIDKVEDIKIINDEYAIIFTTKASNCIRLRDNEIQHFAPDWNNRFSLVGSPYETGITPLTFPAINNIESGVDASDFIFASGIGVNYEVTQNPIVGYNASPSHLMSVDDIITPVAFVSQFDNIDFYFSDLLRDKNKTVPTYYTSLTAPSLSYGLFNNIDLSGLDYPDYIANIVGLFGKVKPSNFGRFYLDDGNTFYSLNMYNGQMFFIYYTSSLLDDIKEVFMVQGQTFAITKSDYLYSVYVDQYGSTSLSDAIANVKGLKFCGAIPEMAVFYSPMDRTLKSFTADHMIRNMNQATLIDDVYYTTYSPQTSAIYICTNNGVYVYSATNQYRLPIYSVEEIYFGGYQNKHTYILHEDVLKEDPSRPLNIVEDYIYDRGYSATQSAADAGAEYYDIQPIDLVTKYYGQGNNLVSTTDCIYFRLYSDEAPFNTSIKIKEHVITDEVYDTFEKKIVINKKDWDEETKTCYIRYQPKFQRSVGLSIEVTSECAIQEINFSNSIADTVAISKPRMNG